jgi:hypothetical protein
MKCFNQKINKNFLINYGRRIIRSLLETKLNTKLIGNIIKNAPATKLNKKLDKDSVINFLKY